jgi:hypothetical protein
VGIESAEPNNEKASSETPSMGMALDEIDNLIEKLKAAGLWKIANPVEKKSADKKTSDRETFKKRIVCWNELCDWSVGELKLQKELKDHSDPEVFRVRRALHLAILMSLHNRVDYYRIKYQNRNYKETSALFIKIEGAIMTYSRIKNEEKKSNGISKENHEPGKVAQEVSR